MDSKAVYGVVEAGVRHKLALAQMEDVDTSSLSADVETVLLASAQTYRTFPETFLVRMSLDWTSPASDPMAMRFFSLP